MSSFRDLLEQINNELDESYEELSKESLDLSEDALPLSDQIANDILMHRNSHFGGKFEFMKEYYAKEGVGIHPDFELEDIEELEEFEQKLGQDIAPLSLSKAELDKIRCSHRMYRALQKICDLSQNPNSVPTLLADLILSEEETPISEIKKLAENEKALPYLIELLNTEEFFDPIFPGYGRAPLLVAKCLGEMGSEKAIIPLFESMKASHFMYEEETILALKKIGQKAFDFLLNVLQKSPITIDNEKAAIALMSFGENEQVATASLKLLQEPEVLSHLNLSLQLILSCLGLKKAEDIETFKALKNKFPSALILDFDYVLSKLKST